MTADLEMKKLLGGLDGFQFASSQQEEEIFHQRDLVRLTPFGLNVHNDSQRPFLLLKNEDQDLTLPVALNPLEAGMTLTQAQQGLTVAPHRFTQLLLQSLSIKVVQCVFIQIKGAHQFVRLYLQGHAGTNSLKVRADEAMSLCLHLNVPIFATRDFIQRSRLMTAEIEGLGKNLKATPQVRQKPNEYIQ